MFSKIAFAILLIGYLNLFVHTTAIAFPGQSISYSGSTSETQISSFVSTFQSLQSAFSQCRSYFSQQVSIEFAIQLITSLSSQYDYFLQQYQSCSACASYLGQQGIDVQQSITQMFSSFQSIVQTGQQNYGSQWGSQLAPRLQKLGSVGDVFNQAFSPHGVDVNRLITSTGLGSSLSKAGIANPNGFGANRSNGRAGLPA